MPFSRNSRNSSRTQSVESLHENMDNPNEFNTEEEVKVYLTDQELQDLMNKHQNKDDISKTISNPLGKMLVQLVNSHNRVVEQQKTGTGQIQITDICKAFQDNFKINKEEIHEVIQESSTSIKQDMYNRDLNFHMCNPLIKAPEQFSSTDVLNTVSKQVDATKLFPQHKQRFTGEPNNQGPPIAEFIYMMNAAQKRLNLSENEFKERLLMSTTSHAHRLIRTLINENDTVAGIYHKLMVLYDFTASPETAKSELLKFRIHRRSTLIRAQAHILQLAAAAARIFPEGALRRAYSNSEACTALIRSLPPRSSTLVASQYNVMISKQINSDHGPLFTELILYLNPYRAQIDKDILENGANFESNSGRSFNDSQQRNPRTNNVQRSRFTANVTQGNRYPPYNNRLQINSLTRTNTTSRDSRPTNKFMNTLYCSLCSKRTHRAADGCYSMKDDNGRVVAVTPTQIPCKICEQKINKKLYHPIRFCFNRNMQQRRSGQDAF